MTDNGMADLISRSAAKAAIRNKFQSIAERCKINEVLNSVSAVDAVPVVRCRDCIYWKVNMLTHFWKPCDVASTDKDWYCPCGKRR